MRTVPASFDIPGQQGVLETDFTAQKFYLEEHHVARRGVKVYFVMNMYPLRKKTKHPVPAPAGGAAVGDTNAPPLPPPAAASNQPPTGSSTPNASPQTSAPDSSTPPGSDDAASPLSEQVPLLSGLVERLRLTGAPRTSGGDALFARAGRNVVREALAEEEAAALGGNVVRAGVPPGNINTPYTAQVRAHPFPQPPAVKCLPRFENGEIPQKCTS